MGATIHQQLSLILLCIQTHPSANIVAIANDICVERTRALSLQAPCMNDIVVSTLFGFTKLSRAYMLVADSRESPVCEVQKHLLRHFEFLGASCRNMVQIFTTRMSKYMHSLVPCIVVSSESTSAKLDSKTAMARAHHRILRLLSQSSKEPVEYQCKCT